MLSHRVWKLFLCSFVLFFEREGFYYWIAYLSELSWRNSFALKWGGSWNYFLSQSSRRGSKMIAFLRALRNIGNCKVVKLWSWNLFLYEEILHYSTLRSEWHGSVFYLRLEICFSGKIIFETQRFFIIPMFLRKQSMNSLANWWSVCFKRIYLCCGFEYAQPPCMKIIFMLFCFIF